MSIDNMPTADLKVVLRHKEREIDCLRALIAELLAALERIEPELYVASEIAHIARVAIAKAKG